jgi:hypothetical protein
MSPLRKSTPLFMVNQKRFFALMGKIRFKIMLFGNHRNHIAVNSAGKQVVISGILV